MVEMLVGQDDQVNVRRRKPYSLEPLRQAGIVVGRAGIDQDILVPTLDQIDMAPRRIRL